VAVLYDANSSPYFLCRLCCQLVYETQHETPYLRALTKADRICDRLGGRRDRLSSIPDKPKGMHWETYRRLRDLAQLYEAMGWIGAVEGMGKLAELKEDLDALKG
jgi:hypothetical protein